MRRGVDGKWRLQLMADIRVGDDVTYHGRVLRVRGISPMSASPRRVLLEDSDTGEVFEVELSDLEDENGADSAA